jgi:hypothetical protein
MLTLFLASVKFSVLAGSAERNIGERNLQEKFTREIYDDHWQIQFYERSPIRSRSASEDLDGRWIPEEITYLPIDNLQIGLNRTPVGIRKRNTDRGFSFRASGYWDDEAKVVEARRNKYRRK